MGRKKSIKVAKANTNIDLNKGQQINGAVESKDSIFTFINKKMFPYSVKTLKEYQDQLEKMNLSDLQRHAIEIAHILPNITDRNRLVKKLENEFLQKLSAYNLTFVNTLPQTGLTTEQSQNIRDVLDRR